MGMAMGQVVHRGAVVRYFQWRTISGFAWSHLLPDRQAYDHHREVDTDLPYLVCTCGQPSVKVLLVEHCAGSITYFPSEACLICNAITGPTDMERYMCTQKLCWKYGCEHFPRKGHPLGSKATN